MTGLNEGKLGLIPTSCVVAAVRGMAISGPMHSKIMVPNTGDSHGWTRFAKSSNRSPELTTASNPKNGNKIPVSPKPRMVVQT